MNLIKVDKLVPSYIKRQNKMVSLKEELWILKKSIVGINLGYDQIYMQDGLYMSIVISLQTEIGPIIIHIFQYTRADCYIAKDTPSIPEISYYYKKIFEEYKQKYFPNEIEDLLTFD